MLQKRSFFVVFASALLVAVGGFGLWILQRDPAQAEARPAAGGRFTPPIPSPGAAPAAYKPRLPWDLSGFTVAFKVIPEWKDPTSLVEIRDAFFELGHRNVKRVDYDLGRGIGGANRVNALLVKASLLLYEGESEECYRVLEEARALTESIPELAANLLCTIIFAQGMASLRRGEDENCVECRGEGSCLLPIRPSAVHKNTVGSRQAVKHFTEYLERIPDEDGVRWLLNLAYMTLGEHPERVPERHLIRLDDFGREGDIGQFRDIALDAGIERTNQAGGAVMDDFDNDGLLDLVMTSWDTGQPMALYRNQGDGTFEDRAEAAGLLPQWGGLYVCQADYDNDGFVDLFVPRGAWVQFPMRPSLLRNRGDRTFADVTREAGMMHPDNAITSAWADYDNDGFLDLFYCSEKGRNKLYRNKGDGTFEDALDRAGLRTERVCCKGIAWLDYDNDGDSDLFLNYLDSTPQLFANRGDGTFEDVTARMGITGPRIGFSCWAFDYDNDGWQDIFATSYQRSLDSCARDIQGLPQEPGTEVTRLWRNVGGLSFEDVSARTGVNRVFATMGSNFADFDNDGFLDFYLATGDPDLSMLFPNRMFRNARGQRFEDVTATSGTGHLQKGHAVACGDLDRDGDVDLFVEMGGATPADRFHNSLFQNPGSAKNRWLTVKLVGKKTNRSAIGARIRIDTVGGEEEMTIHRHVSTGSSFGGNALQQTIGLGKASALARVEITWPASRTTQVFENVAVDQAIEITESEADYRPLGWKPLPSGKD
jgi:hypothetical protein